MPKYKITAETEIIIEADNAAQAEEIFYDEVYEVDRHGAIRTERLDG